MLRRVLFFVPTLLFALTAGSQFSVGPVAAASGVKLTGPSSVAGDSTFALSFALPAGTAAFEGRVLINSGAAQVVGIALNGGVTMQPQEIANGYSIGAYGMPTGRSKSIQIVLAPQAAGEV